MKYSLLLFMSTTLFQVAITRRLLSFKSITKHAKSMHKLKSTKSDQDSASSCNTCNKPIKSTVKPYKRHVIICLKDKCEDWPRAIENVTDSFASRLSTSLNQKKVKSFPIKLTGCNYITSHDNFNVTKVIVYPDGYVIDVTPELFSNFVDIVTQPNQIEDTHLSAFKYSTTPWDKLVLCCIHGNRDKRCFDHGTKIIKAMNEEISNRKLPNNTLAVFGSSHIGGHEYAGTLIVYSKLTGESNWYGCLSSDTTLISNLVDKILSDDIYEEYYRGSGGCGLKDLF